MNNLLQNNIDPQTMRSLSMALIVFGTIASALAVSAVRREGPGLLSKVTDFFFGDRRKPAEASEPTQNVPAADQTRAATAPAPTSRREIDNVDLSIFENF